MKKGGSTRKKPETVQIAENDVVILHDENLPRSRWRLGRVEKLIRGDQDIVRGAVVKVTGKKGNPSRLNRPVSKLFPLEVTHKNTEGKIDILPDTETENLSTRAPRRSAAINAGARSKFWWVGGGGWQGRKTSHVPPSLPLPFIFKAKFKIFVTPPS